MKVEKSSYLKIRMDWLFSIYLVFLVAVIVRYLWLLSQLLRGREPGSGRSDQGELRAVTSPARSRSRCWRSSRSACSGCRSATR